MCYLYKCKMALCWSRISSAFHFVQILAFLKMLICFHLCHQFLIILGKLNSLPSLSLSVHLHFSTFLHSSILIFFFFVCVWVILNCSFVVRLCLIWFYFVFHRTCVEKKKANSLNSYWAFSRYFLKIRSVYSAYYIHSLYNSVVFNL